MRQAAAVHSTLHTPRLGRYYKTLNELLIRATTRGEALQTLDADPANLAVRRILR
jgi:hypothetical protein